MTSQRGRIFVTSFLARIFQCLLFCSAPTQHLTKCTGQQSTVVARKTTTTFTSGFLAKEARFARNIATELCFTQEPSESLGYDSNCP
ncbi:hypothetical protein BDB00DRAFT_827033 [Zychaea mexicana]|uniref:uncharacterized protein n=1 Tax=Zychaea mexicana TaxID=64656 RepID=UPI0022FEF953|nr:uncharacterized protein BDB00DRAFT_827033 [Zychaea mexicana]KAI9492743.1 hypothetical protein BDB00DRAFT_827033 [Zychaea mexicana]